MAKSTTFRGITLKFGADTSTLGKAIKGMENDLKGFNAELADITKALQFNPNSAVLMKQKMELLNKSIEETSKKLKVLEDAQEQVEEKFKNGEIDSGQYNSFIRELEATRGKLEALGREKSRLEELGKGFKEAAKSAEELREEAEKARTEALDKFSDSVGTLKGEVSGTMQAISQIVAKVIAVISAATTAAIAGSSKVGADFEEAMSNVVATMGMDRLSEEYEKLSDFAKKMGATTSFSASQAAYALNYIALAGKNAEEQIAMLPAILNTAKASNMELAAASDMVTDAMSALGLETEEVAEFTDKLAKTAQNSNTSIAQLGEGILQIGGTAKQLSGGVTELNTALGVLANSGIKSEEGGTILRNILNDLFAPTEQAAAMMEKMNLSIYDAEGNLKNIGDIFGSIKFYLDNFASSAEQTNSVLTKMFDVRNLKGVQALLASTSGSFQDLYKKIADSNGAAEQMAATMSDNLKGSLTILKSGLEAVGISIYEKIEEPFKNAVTTAIDEISTLNESLNNGSELETAINKISDGFGRLMESVADITVNDVLPAVIDGLAWIADNGSTIKSMLVGIGTAMLTFKAASMIEKTVVAVKAFNAAVAAGTTRMAALNAVMNTNVFVLVATAIASVTAAVISYAAEAKKATGCTAEYVNALKDIETVKKESITSAKAEYKILNSQIDRYNELREELGNNADESKEFTQIVGELRSKLGENAITVNELTGKYNKLGESAKKAVEDMRQQAEYDARYTAYQEQMKQMIVLQEEVDKARQEYEKLWEGIDKNANLDENQIAMFEKRFSEKTGLKELETQLSDLQAEMKEFEDYSQSFSDNVAENLTETTEEIKTSFEYIKPSGQALAEALENVTENIENYRNSVNSLVSDTNKLSSAFKEQAENGNLSVETALSLIDSGYGLALQYDDTTGSCILLNDKMQELIQSKYAKIQLDLQEKKIDLKEKYDEESKAIDNLRATSIDSENDAKLLNLRMSALENAEIEIQNIENYSRMLENLMNQSFNLKSSAEIEVSAKINEKSIKETENAISNSFKSSESSFNLSEKVDTTDYYKQAFEDEKDALDHALAMNEMTVTDYYLRLNKLLQSHYANKSEYLDEYNKYSETVYKGLLDARKKQLEHEKSLLQSNNEERKKEYDINQALIQLENSRKQKNQRVYYEDRGFVWEQDKKAVAEAENKLNDLIAEKQIDSIEKLIKTIDYINDNCLQLNSEQLNSLYSGNFDVQAIADSIYGLSDHAIKNTSQNNNISITIEKIETNNAVDFVDELDKILSEANMKSILKR